MAVAVAVEVLAEALASEKVLNTIDQQSLFYLDQVRYKHILSIPELSVPTGRITCILGPSGSGKTTFLRLRKYLLPIRGYKTNQIGIPQAKGVSAISGTENL